MTYGGVKGRYDRYTTKCLTPVTVPYGGEHLQPALDRYRPAVSQLPEKLLRDRPRFYMAFPSITLMR